MSDADRKAFEKWANKEFFVGLEDVAETWDGTEYVDFSHHMAWCAWQAGCEWRDSQVGEPIGWLCDFKDGTEPYFTKNPTVAAQWIEDECPVKPVYTPPPTTQINQRLAEALRYARRFLNNKDHDIEFIDAALAAAKETK